MTDLPLPCPARSAVLALLTAALLSACGGGTDGTPAAAVADAGPALSTEAAAAIGRTATVLGGPGVYVDSALGSDTNPGTEALPWKTLAKLASARLNVGEGIYLKCGSLWRESLNLTGTQLVDGSVIAAYGSTCGTSKPKISGADDFSGTWTKTGNVWSRPVPTTTPKIKRLFINRSPQRTAQWPNFGGIGKEYAIADLSSPSSSSLLVVTSADATTLSGKDIVGAALQVRADPWYVSEGKVTAYDATSRALSVQATTSYTMEGGNGYVLQDKKWMLDAPGEFFHDTANATLYLYPSSSTAQADLNAALVEGSVRDTVLTIATRANLSIRGLAATMARQDAVLLNQAPSATIDGIEASRNGRTGIRIALGVPPPSPARGATIKNNVIADNWAMGVDASNVANVSVIANTVTDTGTLATASGSSEAISVGDGAVVDRNSVNRVAYHGIQFSGTGGSKVTGNTVQNYCQRLTDCAGIYAWNASTAAAQRKVNQSSTVSGNRILGAKANTEGAVGGGHDLVAGIYLDNFMINVAVTDNLLTGMPIGIDVHNSSNNVIENNDVWFTTLTGLWANMDQTGGDCMTGNVFRSNQFVPATSASGIWPALPKLGSSLAVTFLHKLSGSASISSGSNVFTQNQVVQLNGVAGAVASVISGSGQQLLTASAWRALNPLEAPLWAPASYSAYSLTEGAELVPGGGFDAGVSPWKAWFWTGASGGGVQSVSDSPVCAGLCARLTAGSIYDTLFSPGFSMSAGVPHVLRFAAAFGGTGTIARPAIGTNTNPSVSVLGSAGYVTLNSLSGSAGDTINFKAVFVPASGAEARVNLAMATPYVPATFDSVSVRPVTGYAWSKASDWSAVAIAPVSSARVIGCTDFGWPVGCSAMDVDGTAIALPATLPAGSRKLLLRLDSPWKQ